MIIRWILMCLIALPATAQTFQHAVVSSADPLASDIGAQVLKDGGNAVDAAVATFFTLAVTYPQAGNIGGGGFMVLRLADGTTAALDFREVAPAAAHRHMYLDSTGAAQTALSQRGALASGVPGSVRGLYDAHRRYGSKPWTELLQPAIRTADAGYAMPAGLAASLNSAGSRLREHGATSFLPPAGERWAAGDAFVQSDLANTLRRIAELGGIMTHTDLTNYESVWRDPTTTSFRGYDLIMMPLPSSGSMVVTQVLGMISHLDLAAMGPHSPEYIHVLAEAERRAFADRNVHLGDPDHITVSYPDLLSRDYLDLRWSSFEPGHATPSSNVSHGTPTASSESTETTHFSIVDASGNAVAITTTLNGSYGSYVEVAGAGFLMNNEMDDFSIKPGTPNMFGLLGTEANAIAPGKRMLSSMTPTIVVKDGDVRMVLGAAGGPRIITSVLHGFLNGAVFGMSAEETVVAKRFHQQHLPDELSIETDALSEAQMYRLKMIGHTISDLGGGGSRVHFIFIHPDGTREGAADPRGYGISAGY